MKSWRKNAPRKGCPFEGNCPSFHLGNLGYEVRKKYRYDQTSLRKIPQSAQSESIFVSASFLRNYRIYAHARISLRKRRKNPSILHLARNLLFSKGLRVKAFPRKNFISPHAHLPTLLSTPTLSFIAITLIYRSIKKEVKEVKEKSTDAQKARIRVCARDDRNRKSA